MNWQQYVEHLASVQYEKIGLTQMTPTLPAADEPANYQTARLIQGFLSRVAPSCQPRKFHPTILKLTSGDQEQRSTAVPPSQILPHGKFSN